MQIREMGKQVQLIRASYVQQKKRCMQTVVYTFKQQERYVVNLSQYLSENAIADLNDGEKETLKQWLIKRNHTAQTEARIKSVAGAELNISTLIDALKNMDVSKEKAARIKRKANALLKVLDNIT